MSITILTELRKWIQGIFIFVYETVIGNLIYSEEKIRQTLRKLPLLCSLRWRPVVDSKDIDGYICVLFEEDMLFLKRLWGWRSKKSTLKELNFGALDVSEYAIMPQRVGPPAEVSKYYDFILEIYDFILVVFRLYSRNISTLFSKCFDFILVTFRLYSRSVSTLFS